MTTSSIPALDASAPGALGRSRRGSLARLADFLRTELAPSPARWRATARITLACVAATALIMTLRLPYGHWLIITIFLVSLPNVGASIEKAILRLAGTVVGAAGVVIAVSAFAQQPWFFLPLVALLIGMGAFLSRTTTYPYVATLGSVTVVLFLATEADHPALAVSDGLWRLGAVALAEVIATTAQLVLWPDDPEELLLGDLSRTLRSVEGRLAALLAPGGGTAPAADLARLRDDGLNGLARQLDLLGNAETRHRALRRRHTEQLGLIAAVNRIVTAALTLETLAAERRAAESGLAPALRERVELLRDGISALRAALDGRRAFAGHAPEPPRTPVGLEDAPLLAPLVEMRRALADAIPATAFLSPDGARAPASVASPLDEGGAPHVFTAACSLANTRDLRFAAQITIAAMTCYLLVVGLDWPGLFTAVVTCVIISQSSFGATMQKATLRLAGAVAGGLVGLVATLVVVPNFDSLPPLLVAVALGTGLAAWVVTGSARISYVGVQIAIAFAMCQLDTFAPSIDLVKPRDRVLGVLLGNVVTAAVTFWVFPVLASRERTRSLEAALRHMAELSRFGLSGTRPAARPARGFRLQIFQDLASTLRLHGEAQFEPGAERPERVAEGERLLALLHEAQGAFLVLLGIVRNRLNVAPGRLPLASVPRVHEIALAVSVRLEAAADAVAGRAPRAAPELEPLLEAAETSLAAEAPTATDQRAVALLRGHLELYRALPPILERLTEGANALWSGAQPARASS